MLKNRQTLAVCVPINLSITLDFVSINAPGNLALWTCFVNNKHPQLVFDTGPGRGMRYDEAPVFGGLRIGMDAGRPRLMHHHKGG